MMSRTTLGFGEELHRLIVFVIHLLNWETLGLTDITAKLCVNSGNQSEKSLGSWFKQ